MATYLNYPFDPELFDYNWKNAVDPTLTAIIDSGAVVRDGEIANLIATGGDYYTIPFYDVIGGTDDNYNGATNITVTSPTGSAQSGIVYGRAHAWREGEFTVDYNSGADPMSQIVSQVSKYWAKKRQGRLIGIVEAVLGISGTAGWTAHTVDISASGTTVTDANKLGATSAGDAAQAACGDNMGAFRLAIMHSKVANHLAGLQLLNFWKYTDERGIERNLNIADYNGLTVIVDDGVPTTAATSSAAATYTSYLFGEGAIRFAEAPVRTPSEITRDALSAGGYNALVTRIRETLHPNGFTFTKPSGYAGSPTDVQLAATANWSLVGDPKAIAIAKIVSNG